MKILKVIVILLAIILVTVLVMAMMAPKSYEVHREITIKAPAEVVWKGISTFEQFNKWNPWAKKDTSQVVKEEGQDGTVGASHSWKGKKMGEGVMTVTKVEPGKSVDYDLHFIKPMEGENTVNMKMEATGDGEKVTWSMTGPMKFPMNVFSMMMNMDKMIGKDFEAGLSDLKQLCESAPAYKINEVNWTEKNCLSVRKTIAFSEISGFFGESYGKIYTAITKAGATTGVPLGVFYKYDEAAKTTDVAAAIPYSEKKNFGKGLDELTLPAAKAYQIDYYGAYDKMKPAYDAMGVKLKEIGSGKPDMVVEEYLTDPMTEKDTAKWHTSIYFFVNKEK